MRAFRNRPKSELRTIGECLSTSARFLDAMRGWAAVVILFHHIFVDGP
jgi:hypothetical protein